MTAIDRIRLITCVLLTTTAIGGASVVPQSATKAVQPELSRNLLLEVNGLEALSLVYFAPVQFDMGRDISRTEILIRMIGQVGQGLDEGPKRRITLTCGFYMARTKMTVKAYCAFLNETENPADLVSLNRFSRIEIVDGVYVPKAGCERCSVNTVLWQGAVAFCRWLSEKTGNTVRLPTEAEWDYAARGREGRAAPWGNDVTYSVRDSGGVRPYMKDGQDLKRYPEAWSCDPVDAFPENVTPDGLNRMADSVGEWCSDYYAESYDPTDLIDPKGPTIGKISNNTGQWHVLRRCMSSAFGRQPGNVHPLHAGIYGFRVVVEPPVSGGKDSERSESSVP